MDHDVSTGLLAGYKRDYYGGALMILIGLGAVVQGATYDVGSLTQMGPGFFPVVLGVILVLLGLSIAGTAHRPMKQALTLEGTKPKETGLDVRGFCCIVVSIVAFVVLGKWGGLVPASFAITLISALGDRDNSWVTSLLLASLITVLCVVIFWWALKLQFPLFTWG